MSKYCCDSLDFYLALIEASEMELTENSLFFEGFTQEKHYYINFKYCPFCGKELSDTRKKLHIPTGKEFMDLLFNEKSY